MSHEESSRFQEKVETSKLQLLANQNVVTLLTSNIGVPSMLYAIVYLRDDATEHLLAWLLTGYCLAFVRFLHHRKVIGFKASNRPLHRFVNELFAFSVISGLYWSSCGILFLNPTHPVQSLALIAATLGLMGGAATALASHARIFFGFISAIWIPAALYYLYVGTAFHISFALAGTFHYFIIIFFSLSQSRVIRHSLILSHENVELLDELKIQKSKAEEANRAKSRFLAVASHDLRQPIHAIRLFSESLTLQVEDEKAKSTTLMLTRSIETLSELFNSLLDMSKLEADAVEPEVSRIQVDQLMKSLFSEFSIQCFEKNLRCVYKEPQRLIIDSDPVLLERILRNLIWNAIKYTDQGGVLLAARKRGNNVRIEIWDTGCGIPSEESSNIFQEFHQVPRSDQEAKEGIGLGLSIVNGLCNLLGYRISMRSRLEEGSVFFVEIPLSTDQSPSILHPLTSQKRSPDNEDKNLNEVKVLIVEDDEDIREAMSRMLKQWGCDVNTADTADTAMSTLDSFAPDIILSDYHLRKSVTGDKVIQRVSEALGYDIPSIIITGDTSEQNLQPGKHDSYRLLHKPVSTELLKKTIIASLNA